ncbi:MAG: sulfatase-like hydrolase/transferase [Rickettsiales bacterium]|jgi:glucan phosphoethanolaminetransferase (alkaline phosphatase superfamily)|nr:sulfatase-like hydrolase/transferase [Rickettsiales bacterium]
MMLLRFHSAKHNARAALWLALAVMAPGLVLRLFGVGHQRFDFEFFLICWLSMFGATFLDKWFLRAYLGLLFVMDCIELHYISYFGFPMHVFDVGDVVGEIPEIIEGGLGYIRFAWFVLPVMAACYWAAFRVYARYAPRLRHSRWFVLLYLAGVLYVPYKTSNHDIVSFFPRATRSSLYNAYNAFSYYVFKGASAPEGIKARPYGIVPSPGTRRRNVVLIIGESVSRGRMSLYGYGRDTTPGLKKIVGEKGWRVYDGISASSATKDSLPMLMNAIYEPCNLDQMRGGLTNLFKIAADNGFATWFITSQDSKLLDGNSMKYADNVIEKANRPLVSFSRGDFYIADELGEIDWSRPNFVVVFTRANHVDYKKRYQFRPEFAKWDDSAGLPRGEFLVNSYDNSMSYLDAAVSEMVSRIPDGAAVAITADHGELLGEGGLYGHFHTYPATFEVPMVSNLAVDSSGGISTHYDLAKAVSAALGARIENENEIKGLKFASGPHIMESCRKNATARGFGPRPLGTGACEWGGASAKSGGLCIIKPALVD